jgi:hypothetical protein
VSEVKVIIDRFEGNLAVCEKEDGSFLDINSQSLPSGAKEGDVLMINGDQITVDKSRTQERRKKINSLMEDMWE